MTDIPPACIVDTLERLLIVYGDGHGHRVQELAVSVGKRIDGAHGLNDNNLEVLGWAARLHDFGKIFIPPDILQKKGRLDGDERALMQTHCQKGSDITSNAGLPIQVRLTMLYHHERFNGGGYPRGISGDDIPLFSRIISICDCWDALISDRPYRRAYTHGMAWSIMNEMQDRFDPRLLSVFWKVIDESD